MIADLDLLFLKSNSTAAAMLRKELIFRRLIFVIFFPDILEGIEQIIH